jgi:hypothetical protein
VTAPGPRDPQAELDHAEWRGWAEANGHDQDCGDCRDAFTAGLQVQRDLDDATLAAEVRAGHVRIETGAQQPAPGHVLVMRGTIALRDAEIELLRKRHEEFAGEILGALLQALGADDDAAPDPGETPERRALRIAAYLGERVDELHGLIAEPAPEP